MGIASDRLTELVSAGGDGLFFSIIQTDDLGCTDLFQPQQVTMPVQPVNSNFIIRHDEPDL